MKSKLFLSLSLLTIAFSVQSVSFKMPSVSAETMLNAKVAAIKIATVGGLGLSAVAANSYMNPEVAPTLTYVQQAQQMIQNGYNSVKANAVKGYDFAKTHPKSTAGAVAAVAALGYVAYNSDLFGKSKAPVVTPVVKPVVKTAKQRLNAF